MQKIRRNWWFVFVVSLCRENPSTSSCKSTRQPRGWKPRVDTDSTSQGLVVKRKLNNQTNENATLHFDTNVRKLAWGKSFCTNVSTVSFFWLFSFKKVALNQQFAPLKACGKNCILRINLFFALLYKNTLFFSLHCCKVYFAIIVLSLKVSTEMSTIFSGIGCFTLCNIETFRLLGRVV